MFNVMPLTPRLLKSILKFKPARSLWEVEEQLTKRAKRAELKKSSALKQEISYEPATWEDLASLASLASHQQAAPSKCDRTPTPIKPEFLRNLLQGGYARTVFLTEEEVARKERRRLLVKDSVQNSVQICYEPATWEDLVLLR